MSRSRHLLSLCAVAALLGAACVPQTAGGGAASGGGSAATVQVALTNAGCVPSPATIAAGPLTFAVRNNGGDRVSEVELMRGDLIVAEKENIAAGLSGSFSVNVPAGDYELYCPGAETERTPFKVSAAAGQAAATVDPAIQAAFKTVPDAYRSYVQGEVDELVKSTDAFVAAVTANDVAKAKDLYAPARLRYERIEPVAESFGDLDPAIDMREDDAEGGEFTGFHRLEKALWQENSLTGMTPVAQQLLEDVRKLQALVKDPAQFQFDAAQVANGSTELLDEVAASKITGEEERYSKLDLLDMAGNVEGSRKGFDLLQPGLKMIDADLATTIESRFTALDKAMAPFKSGAGWVSYDKLSPTDVKTLSQAVNDLAEPMSQVAAKVVVASGDSLDKTS